MNKIIKTLLVVMVVVLALTAFTACDQEVEPTTPVTPEEECTHDGTVEFLLGKNPTCTEDGLTSGFRCTKCGEDVVPQNVDPARHSMAAATCTTPATCTREGCDYTEGEALGHDWDEPFVYASATCTEVGYMAAYCLECGKGAIVAEIPVTEHTVGEDGVCTGCGYLPVETAEQLIAALEAGKNALLMNDIEMDATLKCPYGNAVGVAQKGGVLDGNGHTLTVNGSGNYYAIITYGGTIKNLTINSGFRAIVLYTPTEDVIVDNVTISGDNIVYGLNTAEYPTLEGIDIVVKNSTICGWVSFAGDYASVTFENCEFIQGVAYTNVIGRLVRPYVSTTFTNCSFVKNAYLDLSALEAGETVTLVGCTVDGVDVTVDVFTTEEDHAEIPFTYEAPATGVALYAVEGGVSFHRNGLAVGEDNKIVITDALGNGYGYYITWVYFETKEAAKYTFAGEGLTIWVFDVTGQTLLCGMTGTATLEPGTYAICLAVTAAGETGEFVATVTKHVHAYEAVVTNPTCTEAGYTTYTCACGATYTGNEVAANGHDYDHVVTAPTCTAAGYTTHTCAFCDDSYTDTEVAALGHADNNGDYKCDACSTKMLPADGEALTITQALAVAKAAGTTYTTQKYYITGIVTNVYNTTYGNLYLKDADGNQICIYGLYTWDKAVRYDKMDYKPVEGDELTVYTVLGMYGTTAQGKDAWMDEVVHNHNYAAATCTAPATCSCGETQGEALGHNYVEGVCSNCNGVDPDYAGEVSAPTYVKVTSADQITTGTYVLVVNGKVVTNYDSSSWVLTEAFSGSGDTIVSDSIATWTLTVSGTSVTLKDAKGNFIKPKSGNNNGIQTGSYNWAWAFSNGTVTFKGTGSDTTILALNKQEGKIRAYKTTTVSGNASGYPSNFTLYKLVTE